VVSKVCTYVLSVPSFASSLAASFTAIPTWLGSQTKVFGVLIARVRSMMLLIKWGHVFEFCECIKVAELRESE